MVPSAARAVEYAKSPRRQPLQVHIHRHPSPSSQHQQGHRANDVLGQQHFHGRQGFAQQKRQSALAAFLGDQAHAQRAAADHDKIRNPASSKSRANSSLNSAFCRSATTTAHSPNPTSTFGSSSRPSFHSNARQALTMEVSLAASRVRRNSPLSSSRSPRRLVRPPLRSAL